MNTVYVDLRDQALRTTSATAGASPTLSDRQPYGIVTDLAFPNGYATVVATISGAASIYLSGGGGYIGGEGHEAIRNAAKRAVDVAGSVVNRMYPTKECPLPKSGDVTFYALTKDGVMSASAAENEVKNRDDGLGALYKAVQGVIAQYRLLNSRPR
jgi:hypothetical protein